MNEDEYFQKLCKEAEIWFNEALNEMLTSEVCDEAISKDFVEPDTRNTHSEKK